MLAPNWGLRKPQCFFDRATAGFQNPAAMIADMVHVEEGWKCLLRLPALCAFQMDNNWNDGTVPGHYGFAGCGLHR